MNTEEREVIEELSLEAAPHAFLSEREDAALSAREEWQRREVAEIISELSAPVFQREDEGDIEIYYR